jgi:hypothetical protein
MTIKSAPFYWAVCDRCGQRHEYTDYFAWDDIDTVNEYADDSNWHVEGSNHICEECTPHGPDWDEAHEAAANGAPLDCALCRGDR